MRTLLCIAQHPRTVEAIQAVLPPDQFRLAHRLNLADAGPMFTPGLVDACLLDVESMDIQGWWAVESVRQRLPECPLIVLTGPEPWEWTEEAYVAGADHVVAKPIRPRLLLSLLQRILSGAKVHPDLSSNPPLPPSPVPHPEAAPVDPAKSLKSFHTFSSVLAHSLTAGPLLREFLMTVREILGVNRVAVFLRQPSFVLGDSAAGKALRSACALGLAPGLLEHFELSFETGIGGHLYQHGRILQRHHPSARQSPEIQKEFELLGAQVAIPILDRENLVGVATFDHKVTGEPFSNQELELIFHLLEQLGLAVKNIWLHDRLAASHETLTEILQQLTPACVVVDQRLTLLHVNRAAQKMFGRSGRRAPLAFSDLPHAIGGKVYQVLQTGNALAPHSEEPKEMPGLILQVTVLPIRHTPDALPASVLLVVEDKTLAEQLRHLEAETAQLRLVRAMADRLAHEIGNAIVPMATHQQLLGERFRDAEFRASLDQAMAEGVKRVTRLVNQMRYLARESLMSQDSFPLAPLIDEAFQEANKHQQVKSARLKYEEEKRPIVLQGDRAALRHAFSEVLLNALQANPQDASIDISLLPQLGENGGACVRIEVRDNGKGFAQDVIGKVPTPFFTTRPVGLGLGLCVCQKIVQLHHGSLEIPKPAKSDHGLVRITLPTHEENGADRV